MKMFIGIRDRSVAEAEGQWAILAPSSIVSDVPLDYPIARIEFMAAPGDRSVDQSHSRTPWRVVGDQRCNRKRVLVPG